MDTWINPEGIANTLFITKLEKADYCVTYDTGEEWIVHIPGKKYQFQAKIWRVQRYYVRLTD